MSLRRFMLNRCSVIDIYGIFELYHPTMATEGLSRHCYSHKGSEWSELITYDKLYSLCVNVL